VRVLCARGVPVRAVVRDEARARALLAGCAAQFQRGDAADPESATAACRDAAVVYHAVNLPYSEWERLPGLTENIIAAARAAGARLLFPGNVYLYGLPQAARVSETHPYAPHTRKGRLRRRLECRLLEAHFKGEVPVAIARFPDYYGPNVTNPLIRPMFCNALAGKPIPWPGDPNLPHEFVLIDDAARAMVEIALRPEAFGRIYNIPGPAAVTGHQWAQLLAEAAGKPLGLRRLRPWVLPLAGLFDRQAWEFYEMLYLWQAPVLLLEDGAYTTHVGPLPQTPYPEGIAATMAWWRGRLHATR
ncbi:MAG: NAD-dependent epimerase/dehydratase family protein, partial [Armatimonadota bacterium]|nr:NAD-dependent epimerase/dehydratase family protein [Armatimonadota bacterium]